MILKSIIMNGSRCIKKYPLYISLTFPYQTTQMKKKKRLQFYLSLSYKYHWGWEEGQKACVNLISLNALCWDSESCQLNGQESVKKVRSKNQQSLNTSAASFSVSDTDVIFLLCWVNSAFVKRQEVK